MTDRLAASGGNGGWAGRSRWAVLVSTLMLASLAFTAAAQNAAPPTVPLPRPSPFRPGEPIAPVIAEPLVPVVTPPPVEVAPPLAALPPQPQMVLFTAVLAEGGEPIPDGLHWRVFAERPGPDGRLQLVAEAEGGPARLTLLPGTYLLHTAYGRAGATTRIVVGPGLGEELVVLNAGGLRFAALVGGDLTIPPADLRFEVLAEVGDVGDRLLVAADVRPDDIVRLNAGPYQVVSYYGTTNAIVRADIRVEAGVLTDVTLYHQAARVTLKLVTARGGEALANTAWSVVSAGGEIVFDSVGAFPSVVLAAGDYTAIAKHGDLVFQSPFTVVSGLNRDVEVMAQMPVANPPPAL